MNSPESLREFANELVRRGLPLDYARRSAEELADHHHDLVEELQTAGMDEATAAIVASERLGETKSLVKKTVRAYQRSHWSGRWPVVTFLIGPIVLMVAAWMATFLGLFAIGNALAAIGRPIPESSRELSTLGLVTLYGGVAWCLLIIPVGLVTLLSRWAYRSSVSRLWVLVSAVVLGLSAGLVRCGFLPGGIPEHPFMIQIPFPFPFGGVSEIVWWYLKTPQQVAQVIVPLLMAAILVWRDTARRGHLEIVS